MNSLIRAALWLVYYTVLAPVALLALWLDPLQLRSRGWRKPED